jgi:hypothetical protein
MASRNGSAILNGRQIQIGDFLRIEFEEGLLRWVIVSDPRGPASVRATILEEANAYKQRRSMVISFSGGSSSEYFQTFRRSS